jgi:rhodanese-related sulfurtransferase
MMGDTLTKTVIDMRTPELYAASHVPGAVNLTLKQLQESTVALNKDRTIIVYAYDITCALSTKTALPLAKQGFAVKELYGNFAEYVAGKYPPEGTSVGAACGQGCG